MIVNLGDRGNPTRREFSEGRAKMKKPHLRLFEVDVNRVFPFEDPRTISLLQFMAAVNDTITAQLCFLSVDEGANTEADNLLAAARRNYFFRLACGHLYEGLSAFRQAIRAGALQSIVERMPDEGRKAYETLLAAADPDNRDTFWYRVLKPIRDAGIFHYLSQTFRKAISTHPPGRKGRFILGPTHADTRFIFSDDLISQTVLGPVIGVDKSEEAGQAVAQVVRLQGALANLFHWLLVVFFEENRDAIREVPGEIG